MVTEVITRETSAYKAGGASVGSQTNIMNGAEKTSVHSLVSETNLRDFPH